MNNDASNLPYDIDKLRSIIVSLESKNQDLTSRNSHLESENKRLESEKVELESEKKELESEKNALESKKNYFESEKKRLEEYVRLLKKELFGRKTEKLPKEDRQQMRLFDEAEAILEEEKKKPEKPVSVAPYARKKPGRKPLPKDLPRIEVVHDIDESQKVCACGATLTRIGEDTIEKLEIIPAKVQVIRHIRPKYACKNCEGVEDDGPTVKIAPPPPQIIPKGIATPTLLAYILISKFEDALPFYRQEKIFKRIGVDLSRADMANWAIRVANQCVFLLWLLCANIRGGPFVGVDETPVQVMKEPGRANTAKSYMWVFRGGDPEKPSLVYQYHPTRSGDVPKDFLKGFEGYLQSDGFSGYEAIARQPEIIHVGCWAHVRRKFHDVVKASGGEGRKSLAKDALEMIGELYAVEKEADQLKYSYEKRAELRKEKSAPILEKFKAWLDDHAVKTPRNNSLLGKAINYALNRWKSLTRFIEDGRIRPDNNLVENAIRPFAVGRRNWLFSGSPRGAEASAAIYSLIETAKANGLDPYYYLRYIFEMLPLAQTEEDYRKLLPQNIDKSQIEAARE
jgi:transposase